MQNYLLDACVLFAFNELRPITDTNTPATLPPPDEIDRIISGIDVAGDGVT